jgi:hypothetical protein
MPNKKNETRSTAQSSKPDKEVIKKNSDQQKNKQSKKDTKAEHVERNYDKDQE